MVPFELSILAIVGYLAALLLMLLSMRRAVTNAGNRQQWRIAGMWVACMAVVFHGVAIFTPQSQGIGTHASFLGALSLVTLSVNTLLLLAAIFKPVDNLGVITFPMAVFVLVMSLVVPEETRIIHDHSWQMTTHIFTSLLAYSFLNIAAIQAIVLAIQDAGLRSRHTGGFLLRSLPSLQSMENLMFQLIGAGLLLLTISLVSGFAFLENMFAQHLAHKTILSLLAWLVFTVLLVGRYRYGWRGQIAFRWALSGFFFLVLAYFGSKLVLQLILNRV